MGRENDGGAEMMLPFNDVDALMLFRSTECWDGRARSREGYRKRSRVGEGGDEGEGEDGGEDGDKTRREERRWEGCKSCRESDRERVRVE